MQVLLPGISAERVPTSRLTMGVLSLAATRGLGDYADDLAALIETLGLAPAHLAGWSMGGGVVLQYLSERRRGHRAASVTLVGPLSPFGFGGTRGAEGALCDPSGAGSGGGAANADFVARLAAGDRSGHGPHLDQPEQFRAALAEHLAEA